MRIKYWSSSKLADFIRGTKKPVAETSLGWREWEDKAKSKHPFRFWIADTLLDFLQDVCYYIPDKIRNAKHALKNRFAIQTHALVADKKHLPRYQWHDLDSRMLFCMFDSFSAFVEIEKASMQLASTQAKRPSFLKRMLGNDRNPDAGTEYLKWEASLVYNEDYGVFPGDSQYGKKTPQAEAAIEMLDLYNWWTQVYPNRPDPYEVSGWDKMCYNDRKVVNSIFEKDTTEDEAAEISNTLQLTRSVEAQYYKEEQEMLVRLINVRNALWT